jgi:ASC-1-like (ASCH) protein
MFMLLAKKEVLQWIAEGKKTIDVRKGNPRSNEPTVLFASGTNQITATVTKKETGKLTEIITEANYKLVIPTAQNLQDAYDYLHAIYRGYDGVYTAYYIEQTK